MPATVPAAAPAPVPGSESRPGRSADPTPYVLGGSRHWWFRGWTPLELGTLGLLVAVVVLPLRGLYRHTGAAMEEGFMLVFPTLVQRGKVPNADFLHLYGPASLDVLALWYRVAGDSLESERTFGLLQHLGLIAAVWALTRVAGRVAAGAASIVAAFMILTPIGLSALAWHGGLALAAWSLVAALRATATGHLGAWWVAGGLAGLSLGYRPDLVIAAALALGFVLWGRTAVERTTFVAGLAIGVLPLCWHVARAGLRTAFDGMVREPVVELRPARELPRPPSWGEIDGALQAVAEGPPPRWWLPAPAASQQLFLWFWLVILVAVGAAVWALLVWRRHRGGDDEALARDRVLAAAALFGLGILPQALQRPDSTHLAWVAVISWPVAVALGAMAVQCRRAPRSDAGRVGGLVAGAVAALVLVVICPFWTYRTWALQTRVAVGDLPPPFVIERDGHRFWVGDPVVADAVNQMLPDLDAITDPGDTLIVGTGDLSRTVYVDTYIYWLFPELVPGTRFIEMEPGITDAAGSGLAEEIAAADVIVLTNTWSGWVEPNASVDHGSDEHNRAVAEHHCLVASYASNLVLLFERCEGGGGFDPSIVAGRTPGGGGIPSP